MREEERAKQPEDEKKLFQAEIENLRATVAEQDATIAKQNAIIAEQQEVIARQQGMMGELTRSMEEWRKKFEALERRVSKDSHNSSLPPSSDRFGRKRKTRSLRKPSGKKAGGQPGHEGHTCVLVEHPDQIEVHELFTCPHCQYDVSQEPVLEVERRQVLEMPVPRLVITEHQAERKSCPMCQKIAVAAFPDGVEAAVQYGPRVQALGTYVHQYHLVPLARTCLLLKDLLGLQVSTGSLRLWVHKAARGLVSVETQIKEALKREPVTHHDETGLRIAGKNGKQHWCNVISSSRLTHYQIHRSRGQKAMVANGFLPSYEGVAVHDCLESYFVFGCRHALCVVHLLRELVYMEERYQQPWARDMILLLGWGKQWAEAAKTLGLSQLPPEMLRGFRLCYVRLIRAGQLANPPPDRGPRPRPGRTKRTEAGNLLHRLFKYRCEVLTFLSDLRVPFDNSLAERDLRMVKVQQKISGCFRSEEGAADFARIRGYLSTLRKQGLDLFEALHRTLAGRPLLPTF
jgi:transposase/uncharacterized coiled-coil protein SlyX